MEFKFTGTGNEYFKIWVVNLLLSIATLGIYSAWAKVRTARYFYGNTHLDGASFAYAAKPLQILKGRLLAVAVLVGYTLLQGLLGPLSPIITMVITAVGIVLILPWVVVQSLTFHLRYSRYRNIAFGCDGLGSDLCCAFNRCGTGSAYATQLGHTRRRAKPAAIGSAHFAAFTVGGIGAAQNSTPPGAIDG